MKRSRKFILIGLLVVVVLAGSIGGVVLAQTENVDDSPPGARHGAMLDRVSEIYEENTGVAIDSQELQNAFTQARSEMCDAALENGDRMRPEGMLKFREMDPETMQDRLQNLFDEGKITQEQYEKKMEWIESMPDDMPRFGFRGHGGFRGFGMHSDGFPRWGGLYAPQNS